VKAEAQPDLPEEGATRSKVSSGEAEIIDICVRIAQFVGLPKSVGEIYGLLFATPRPLTLDEIIDKLSISQGSASQGIRLLKTLGAVKPHYVPGDRRDFHSPETGLGRLAEGFLKARVVPGLEDLNERLSALDTPLTESSQDEFLRNRKAKLQSWQKQAASVTPLLSKLLKAV